MDGDFVPSISFGMPVLKSIRKRTDLYLDAHLMVTEPDRYIDAFVEAGADGITVHAEACRHLDRTVQHIKACGKKAAVALNPATPARCARGHTPGARYGAHHVGESGLRRAELHSVLHG